MTSINLARNNLGEEGANNFSTTLTKNRSIEHIDLS